MKSQHTLPFSGPIQRVARIRRGRGYERRLRGAILVDDLRTGDELNIAVVGRNLEVVRRDLPSVS